MQAFEADYFDGITAKAQPVRVSLHEGRLSFSLGEQHETFLLAALRPQAPLGSARRIIELPDGGRLETDDHAAFDSLRLPAVSGFWRLLYFLENHLGWVIFALVLTVAMSWGLIRFGVPVLAEQVANVVPADTEIKLGEQVLKAMDHDYGYFKPSTLSAQQQQALSTGLQQFCARQPQPQCPAYRLEFRHGGVVGANAMALPGGIIVLTDELVALSKHNNDQVIAVLAHELGHVAKRHSLRHTLQATFSGLVIVALTGDFDTLASGLPAILLQMQYSRAMETEADTYALNSLQHACVPTQSFVDILQALQRQADEKTKNQSKASMVAELLSSHPDTAARVRAFKQGLPAHCVH